MDKAFDAYEVHGSESIASLELEIPEELEKAFESLPETQRWNMRDWEEWEDRALLKYWPAKLHVKVAKLLGVSVGTALKRYRFLIEKSAKSC